MKKFFISVLAALMLATPICGEVIKQGNTFVQIPKEGGIAKSKTKPVKTKFTYKDSKGVEYPIYISENGSCFVYKISKKTGKEYKQYLGKEMSMQICKELGITYKGKK